jgi:hypothetical protein
MTETNPGYQTSPNESEPQSYIDLRDKVAELQDELERAYAMGDSVCDIMVSALERRELQMLRREHAELKDNLADVDALGWCPICFGPVEPSGEVDHYTDCPFAAIERFQERHG